MAKQSEIIVSELKALLECRSLLLNVNKDGIIINRVMQVVDHIEGEIQHKIDDIIYLEKL